MDSQRKPILLYDDQCNVCRHIASWIRKLARDQSGQSSIFDRPIGNDPENLRALNPSLDIWDAYATIHVVMPDGSMKLGGEAVAEVFRQLPETRWFTWILAIGAFGFRPFQAILNLAYVILSDVRPIFGCESCGSPAPWVKPIRWLIKVLRSALGGNRNLTVSPHFTPLSKESKPTTSLPQSNSHSKSAAVR